MELNGVARTCMPHPCQIAGGAAIPWCAPAHKPQWACQLPPPQRCAGFHLRQRRRGTWWIQTLQIRYCTWSQLVVLSTVT